tara:strand:- start:3477 stop:4988 length:1512 start_codon:yes stop_codon:yes gene_type:complete
MVEMKREDCEKQLYRMATPEFKNNLLALLKSRRPLIYITTSEERRLLQYFEYLCAARGYVAHVWDCFEGLVDLETKEVDGSVSDDIKDAGIALEHIINHVGDQDAVKIKQMEGRGVRGDIFIMLDFHHYLDEAAPGIERRIKKLAKVDSVTAVVVVAPYFAATPSTENLFALLDLPFPNNEELHDALWMVVNAPAVKNKINGIVDKTEDREEDLIKAASGLTLEDAYSAYAKSIVIHRDFNISTILDEKRQIIQKAGTLEFCEQEFTIDDVGGLPKLIHWIKRRRMAFKKDAADFCLKSPAGLFLVGIPGSGKSLTAKAIASAWEMPLLRLDFGSLFNALQGESERSARECIKLAETISPCVPEESIVQMSDGGFKTMGDWFAESCQIIGNRLCDLPEDEEVTIPASSPAMGYSMDGKCEVSSQNTISIIRRPKQVRKMITICTDDGMTIKATEDHRVLVENDGKQDWKKLKELSVGDSILTLWTKERKEKIIEKEILPALQE